MGKVQERDMITT